MLWLFSSAWTAPPRGPYQGPPPRGPPYGAPGRLAPASTPLGPRSAAGLGSSARLWASASLRISAWISTWISAGFGLIWFVLASGFHSLRFRLGFDLDLA